MTTTEKVTSIVTVLEQDDMTTLSSDSPPPKASYQYKPPDYSDAGNAELFERLYIDSALYTVGGGWFVWDGTHWCGSDHKAMQVAVKLSKRMRSEAIDAFCTAKKVIVAQGADASEAVQAAYSESKLYLAHAEHTRQKVRLCDMLALAKSALCVKLETLDPNPLDLNTPKGIITLDTGNIRPHDPYAFCSKITKVSPSNVGKRMWLDFINSITDGDGGVGGFLQQVAGMALYGKVFHEGIIMAHGGGRNGKSTFFNALATVLGDYAGNITVNTLTTERNNKGATLATLRGKRLVLTGELEEHQRLSVAMLKSLAATDTIVAEEKFRQPECFSPSHTICLYTNHLPRVGSTDNGTWRRLTVVPFTATISTQNAIQDYGSVLAARAGGAILQWAIDGAVLFANNGYKLNIPDAVAIASEEYRASEDWVANFVAERCTKGDRVGGAELYAAYRQWAESNGEYARRVNDFVAAFETAGYRKMVAHGRKYWIGIALDTAQSHWGATV